MQGLSAHDYRVVRGTIPILKKTEIYTKKASFPRLFKFLDFLIHLWYDWHIMKWKNKELEKNQMKTSLAVFMEAYNQKIPQGFPQATVETLKKFKASCPALFKNGNEWSILRHRKRLMDWLSSNQNVG